MRIVGIPVGSCENQLAIEAGEEWPRLSLESVVAEVLKAKQKIGQLQCVWYDGRKAKSREDVLAYGEIFKALRMHNIPIVGLVSAEFLDNDVRPLFNVFDSFVEDGGIIGPYPVHSVVWLHSGEVGAMWPSFGSVYRPEKYYILCANRSMGNVLMNIGKCPIAWKVPMLKVIIEGAKDAVQKDGGEVQELPVQEQEEGMGPEPDVKKE